MLCRILVLDRSLSSLWCGQSSGVLEQNTLDLLNRLGISLYGVSGVDDLLRFHSLDVCALILDDSVACVLERAFTVYSDDRVRDDAVRNRNSCQGFNEGISRSHIGNARGNVANGAHVQSLGLECQQLNLHFYETAG